MGAMRWTQFDRSSIQVNASEGAWNTGHVAAVLPWVEDGAVVAADTGGVWLVNGAVYGYAATPWGDLDSPDLMCMVHGPDGEQQLFVGGGTTIGLASPELVAPSADRLDAFAIGQDHALWHVSRVSGVWSMPDSLGGDLVGSPAVCSWGADRIDAFAVAADGALLHTWWDGASWSPSTTGYERLGDLKIVGQPSAVASGANRLDVFVVGTDGGLYHKWLDGEAWGPPHDTFESLGGNAEGSPTALSTAAGRLDVFCVRASDRALLHKVNKGSGWLPSPTEFEVLGPVDNVPAAASWGNGTIHLCAVLADGTVGYKMWDGAQWQPSPTGWTSLGASPKPFVTAPTVASWGLNRLDVVCVDADGVLQHKWFDGAAWGPSGADWEAMGSWPAGRAALVAPAPNRLDILVAGGEALYAKSYGSSGWVPSLVGWTRLTPPTIGALHESGAHWTWRNIEIPQEAGRVLAMTVVAVNRYTLVLACERGVWWAPIPDPVSQARGARFIWTRAVGMPDCAYSGIAATSSVPGLATPDGFAVAAWGSDVGSGAYGIFYGNWSGGVLQMRRAATNGVDPRLMGRTSLASCEGQPSSVYCVSSDVANNIYTDPPDAVCWGPNRIDVFHRGYAADCQHLSWNGATWSWDSLGGILLSPPRAVSRGPGRLDVFGVATDGALNYKWWDGSQWRPGQQSWKALGGRVIGQPAVCSWGANRLDVFVVQGDGMLYWKWWDGSSWLPSENGYEPLGVAVWGSPAAVAPAVDRIQVYYCGTDGKLHVIEWNGAGWRQELLGDEQVFLPTAVVAGAGAVHVFAVGAGGNVLHKLWDGSRWLPSLTTYDDLGGVCWGGPSAVIDGATVDVYVRGTDNQVWVNTWDGTGWSGWSPHGGNSLGTAAVAIYSAPKVVSWGPGRRDAFAVAPTSSVTPHGGATGVWDLSSGGGALTWEPLGGDLMPGAVGGQLYAFLKSADGGVGYQPTLMYRTDDPNHWGIHLWSGNQGGYNNCLAIRGNAAYSGTVAVGWRKEGPFLTTDGGDTWRWLNDQGKRHLHSDLHALCIEHLGPNPGDFRLFVGSDGGLSATTDTGATWDSRYNQNLFTLQVYGGSGISLSASPGDGQSNGLVAAGLQDNGDIISHSGPPGQVDSWHEEVRGDGGVVLSLATGQVLYNSNNSGGKIFVLRDGGASSMVPVTVPKPGPSPDLSGLAVNPNSVRSPSYTNQAGELMLAAGATGNDLYGAFARADGSNIHWEYLGTIAAPGATITCVSTNDGRIIFAGLTTGGIVAFDTATSTVTPHRVRAGKDGPGAIMRIVMHSPTHAFAIGSRGPNGFVLRYRGDAWERVERNLPVETFWALASDVTVDPPTNYVCTDSRVYASSDDGDSWQNASTGLPQRAHIDELQFERESNGDRYLYAGTYGRSIFRSLIT